MIERYTRSEMGLIWTLQSRFEHILKVEVAVALAQGDLGIIPKKAAQDIQKKSKFNVDEILEIEKKTKHDMIALVTNVAKYVGENGKYVHFGMTSSDAVDTALSLQIATAHKVLLKSIKKLKNALLISAKKNADVLCAGRTHGIHAEPTSFGLKLTGFLFELERNERRLSQAVAQAAICKLSGAVGTYSAQSREVEIKVAKSLELIPEDVATQVIPRDRHAEVFLSISLLGAFLERLAVELRHLQRTEVSEVIEGFSKGQKGSSAMPHKKNPISAENITGLARLLRSYAIPALENVALWHERDISHSSVERVVFPDAFILADYACDRMADLISGLEVDEKKMAENMELSKGQLFSSHVLLEMVKSGKSREDAYAIVQRLSHSLKPGQKLEDAIRSDKEAKALVTDKALKEIFSGDRHKKAIKSLVSEKLKGMK